MQRHILRVGIGFGAGITVVLVGWYIFRPPNWQDASQALRTALTGGDPRPLSQYLWADELKAFGLDRAGAISVAEELVRPNMQGVELIEVSSGPSRVGSRVSVQLQLSIGGEGRAPGGAGVVDGPDGPKVELTSLLIQCFRVIQLRGELNHDESWRQKWNALAAELTERGISGPWRPDGGILYPWRTY